MSHNLSQNLTFKTRFIDRFLSTSVGFNFVCLYFNLTHFKLNLPQQNINRKIKKTIHDERWLLTATIGRFYTCICFLLCRCGLIIGLCTGWCNLIWFAFSLSAGWLCLLYSNRRVDNKFKRICWDKIRKWLHLDKCHLELFKCYLDEYFW